eukprot:scaffold16032_cov63-Phaeocystis_antarctica.AAC.2
MCCTVTTFSSSLELGEVDRGAAAIEGRKGTRPPSRAGTVAEARPTIVESRKYQQRSANCGLQVHTNMQRRRSSHHSAF